MDIPAPIPIPPKPQCPVCGKPVIAAHMPFCSARCQHVDLHRWMGEVYRINSDDSPTLQESDDEM